MADKFEVSKPTTDMCMPGSMRGTVRDRRAGGKSYQYFIDVATRKVTNIYQIVGGDPSMPNTRPVDKSSVKRIMREVEAAIAA